MKRTPVLAALFAGGAVLAALGFVAGRWVSPAVGAAPAAAAASAPAERRVLYWHDPMTPGPRFDKPGKSPFMDMELVPVYADAAAGNPGEATGVAINGTVQQNLGMRLAAVRRAEVASSFDAVGSVQFDERLGATVQSRVAGFVEHLAVRATMERVRPGQALATVYAPDWLGPLNELAALKRAGASADLLAAARDRTRALSIPPELLRQVEEGQAPNARYVLTAPIGGVIAELGVREGAAVSAGMPLFRIAGLDKVWAVAEIPEAQALRLKRGQAVQAHLQADPAQGFKGTLAELLPEVNASTRTLKARFEVDNRLGLLVPGMLLRLQVQGGKAVRLLVPAEAVIRTGPRAVVLVRTGSGRFESRDVTLGLEVGEDIEVLQGLTEGEQVVASGQFLVDSEARLRSVVGSLGSPGSAGSAAAAASGAAR
jgi:Cu(I)/Ag(I) efflux system membrane fusion protein